MRNEEMINRNLLINNITYIKLFLAGARLIKAPPPGSQQRLRPGEGLGLQRRARRRACPATATAHWGPPRISEGPLCPLCCATSFSRLYLGGAFSSNPAVFVSCLRPDSLQALRSVFKARIRESLCHLKVRIEGWDGKTLAMLCREAEILGQSSDGMFMEVEIRANTSVVGRVLKLPSVRVIEEIRHSSQEFATRSGK